MNKRIKISVFILSHVRATCLAITIFWNEDYSVGKRDHSDGASVGSLFSQQEKEDREQALQQTAGFARYSSELIDDPSPHPPKSGGLQR